MSNTKIGVKMEKDKLISLVKDQALELAPEGKPFILKSGAESTFYLDCRKITLTPLGLTQICSHTMYYLATNHIKFDAVGGPCVGADPIVGGLLQMAVFARPKMRGFLVRKEEKDHGKAGRIIGSVLPGDNVVVVEDVTTSGGSLLSAVEAVEEFGAKVVQVISVIDRNAGATELFEKHKIPFHSLLTLDDLGIK